jgi:hypothetical protein
VTKLLAAGATLTLAVAPMIGCAGSNGTLPGSESAKPNSARVHAQSQVTPPPFGVYLGAQVNPAGDKPITPQEIISQTHALETSMGRTLALHLHYDDWNAMNTISADTTVADDIANGRMPVLSWTCADNIVPSPKPTGWQPYNLIQIAQGAADNDLRKIASQLSLLKYNDGTSYPVMIRYFWEFNLNATSQNDDSANGNGGCFVYGAGANNETLQTQFTNAWIHIWNVFAGLTPRPNVSFDWNPNAVPDPDSVGNPIIDSPAFYPGQTYVDWIGLDGYSKYQSNGNPATFSQKFLPDYTNYTTNPGTYGTKPIMVGETGACAQYGSPYDQATYIGSIQTGVETGSPAPFSKIAAVNYFDAPGGYNPVQGPCNWDLTTAGLNAFVLLGRDPYFLPMITE